MSVLRDMDFFSTIFTDFSANSSQGLTVARYIIEVGIGLYLLDLITGIVHMYLDYQTVKDRDLRLHVERNIDDIVKFETTDALFMNATPNDKYLWNFHVHHDAPYPSVDSEWELTMQLVRPLTPAYLLSVALWYYGHMNPTFARIWFGALTAGPAMQKTHFLAHARNHGVLTKKTLGGWIICTLQDTGFLLSPASHKRHHEEFDCNFCIFNGWANPLVNQIRKLLSVVGIFPLLPPTAQARLDRSNDEAAAKKVEKKNPKVKGKTSASVN